MLVIWIQMIQKQLWLRKTVKLFYFNFVCMCAVVHNENNIRMKLSMLKPIFSCFLHLACVHMNWCFIKIFFFFITFFLLRSFYSVTLAWNSQSRLASCVMILSLWSNGITHESYGACIMTFSYVLVILFYSYSLTLLLVSLLLLLMFFLLPNSCCFHCLPTISVCLSI